MKLLFLDFETQSDDPATTNATEVGAVLAELNCGVYSKVASLSTLIYDPSYPPQTEEIVGITGITDEMLKQGGLHAKDVVGNLLNPLFQQADYYVAHNAEFDRGVYETLVKRHSLGMDAHPEKWICSLHDIPWDKKYKCKKLSHLAYDHGIMVDPRTLHRAVNDVELLISLFSRYNLESILQYKNTPWVVIRANVPPPWEDGGVGTTHAKKLGFSWEKVFGSDKSYPKKWVKRVKEDKLEEEKKKCPFPLTKFVEGDSNG